MNLNTIPRKKLSKLEERLNDKRDTLIKLPRPFTNHYCRLGRIHGRIKINLNRRLFEGRYD